eukprot:123932-Pelagomonas_calceolata.AAC.3
MSRAISAHELGWARRTMSGPEGPPIPDIFQLDHDKIACYVDYLGEPLSICAAAVGDVAFIVFLSTE